MQKLAAYIAAHPAEIPLVDEPDKRLPTRPPQPPARNAAEWVQQRMADAQLLLWRKSCKECHALRYPNGFGGAAGSRQAGITARWLPHAEFDHKAHQMVECVSCHAKATRAARHPTCCCRVFKAAGNAITRAKTPPKRAASNATSITTGARKNRSPESS